MRWRVALPRILMEERSVILMDEPFSAIDLLYFIFYNAYLSNSTTSEVPAHALNY